jgi:Transcriptional regulators
MDDKKMNELTDNILMLPAFYQKVVSSKQRKFKSPIYYQVICMLEREGDLPMSVIGDKLFMSRPHMTWNIDKLVTNGMVERVADEKDRRVIKISVTPKGKEFLKKSRKQVNEYIEMNLSSLSDNEFEELYNSMKTIKKVLLKIRQV